MEGIMVILAVLAIALLGLTMMKRHEANQWHQLYQEAMERLDETGAALVAEREACASSVRMLTDRIRALTAELEQAKPSSGEVHVTVKSAEERMGPPSTFTRVEAPEPERRDRAPTGYNAPPAPDLVTPVVVATLLTSSARAEPPPPPAPACTPNYTAPTSYESPSYSSDSGSSYGGGGE